MQIGQKLTKKGVLIEKMVQNCQNMVVLIEKMVQNRQNMVVFIEKKGPKCDKIEAKMW